MKKEYLMEIKEGQKAPAICLPASNGKTVTLKEFKDKKIVVLYFYPKDDTSGCTVQACGLRDDDQAIRKLGAVVLGVSPDPIRKHEQFIMKHDLPFILLSDEEKKTCQDYGVWVEKSMYGRKYMGVARTTFIIDKNGIVVKRFDKVKPQKHSADVIKALNELER